MTAFTRQIATAKRLILKNGAKCIWRVIPNATENLNEPWKVTPVANIDYVDIPIVFLPYNRINYEFMRVIVGTEIQTGDVKGLMAQQNFKPTIADVIIHPDGSVYRINKIDPLAPDGTDILYTLDLKL